jgi:hypothetical protein
MAEVKDLSPEAETERLKIEKWIFEALKEEDFVLDSKGNRRYVNYFAHVTRMLECLGLQVRHPASTSITLTKYNMKGWACSIWRFSMPVTTINKTERDSFYIVPIHTVDGNPKIILEGIATSLKPGTYLYVTGSDECKLERELDTLLIKPPNSK